MLVPSLIVCVLLATANLNVFALKSYSQHQLWRLHAMSNEQVVKLLDFSHIAYQHNINFWSDEFRTNVPVKLNFEKIIFDFFSFWNIRLMLVLHLNLSKVSIDI